MVADPFGSSLCLILAGLLFARRLYRLNVLTIGDYYRIRYNRAVEVLCTLCIVASYLGWVSAQIKALGLTFHVVTDGAVAQPLGMVIGAAIVLTYTTFGGMFSVAILDFVQITVYHGRDALYRIGDQRLDRWSCRRSDSCRFGGQARLLSIGRDHGMDSFYRRMDDHDVGIHSATGCVSADHLCKG